MLDIPPKIRNNSQIRLIERYFEGFKYFDGFQSQKEKKEVLHNFAKYVKIEKYMKGDIVFYYGTPSNKFYIILSGGCQIYIPKKKEKLQEEVIEEKIRRTRLALSGKHEKESVTHSVIVKEEKLYLKNGIDFSKYKYDIQVFEQHYNLFLYNHVADLGIKDHFGEVGLTNGDSRSAMIVASVDSSSELEK